MHNCKTGELVCHNKFTGGGSSLIWANNSVSYLIWANNSIMG